MKIIVIVILSILMTGCVVYPKVKESQLKPEWSEEMKELIRNNQLALGMNTEQVKLSYGPPNRTRRGENRRGKTLRWTYTRFYELDLHLYFVNDILVDWERYDED